MTWVQNILSPVWANANWGSCRMWKESTKVKKADLPQGKVQISGWGSGEEVDAMEGSAGRITGKRVQNTLKKVANFGFWNQNNDLYKSWGWMAVAKLANNKVLVRLALTMMTRWLAYVRRSLITNFKWVPPWRTTNFSAKGWAIKWSIGCENFSGK